MAPRLRSRLTSPSFSSWNSACRIMWRDTAKRASRCIFDQPRARLQPAEDDVFLQRPDHRQFFAAIDRGFKHPSPSVSYLGMVVYR